MKASRFGEQHFSIRRALQKGEQAVGLGLEMYHLAQKRMDGVGIRDEDERPSVEGGLSPELWRHESALELEAFGDGALEESLYRSDAFRGKEGGTELVGRDRILSSRFGETQVLALTNGLRPLGSRHECQKRQ